MITAPHLYHCSTAADDTPALHSLVDGDEAEVLSFLAARPIDTVFLAGLIYDNGLVNSLNRGSFYACRNEHGELDGVALIGHAILIEARTRAAVTAFARLAQRCLTSHLIRGEQEQINLFWRHYASGERSAPRRVCRELLLEQRRPIGPRGSIAGLRIATPDDLASVMAINAEMAHEESGVNPLESDPVGFHQRTARRIARGRVWVWTEGRELIFKADILADTPEAIYLEGIYVHPEQRGKGYGPRCMSQLGHILLSRANALCLLVNEENRRARNFYHKVGFEFQSRYDTIYLPAGRD